MNTTALELVTCQLICMLCYRAVTLFDYIQANSTNYAAKHLNHVITRIYRKREKTYRFHALE